MNKEFRKKLKLIVISVLLLFLVIYAVFMYVQFSTLRGNSSSTDSSIVLRGKTLTIFGKQEILDGFPDRIALHYPYFLLIKAEKRITEVYNIQTQKIVKTYAQPILDYYNGQVIYNGNGYHTYLNDKDLGIFCDQAFISSNSEILCVTRPDLNSLNNVLVSINPKTLINHIVYSPRYIITAVYKEKSTLYIAEFDYAAKKGHVVVNGNTTNVPGLINAFYEMNGQVYAVSFMSVWNKNTESFEVISVKNGILTQQRFENGRIIFY